MITNQIKILIRTILYSFSISFLLILLNYIFIYKDEYEYIRVYILPFNLSILLLETFFSAFFIKKHNKHLDLLNVIQTIFLYYWYILLSIFAISFYFIISNNLLINFLISIIFFAILCIYMYYLHYYLAIKYKAEILTNNNIFTRFEFSKLLLKFFTYFICNFTLLTYLFLNFLNLYSYLLIFFILNFSIFTLHLAKKELINTQNLITSFLYSIILTFFIYITPFMNLNINVGVNLIYFYLSFSIFYHSINRTLNKKLLLEYIFISVFITLLLFFIK